jgi:hypothetical protein
MAVFFKDRVRLPFGRSGVDLSEDLATYWLGLNLHVMRGNVDPFHRRAVAANWPHRHDSGRLRTVQTVGAAGTCGASGAALKGRTNLLPEEVPSGKRPSS